MSETKRLIDQLERAYRGGAWHGPALLELLETVSPGRAFERPLPRAHSIAELVLHIAAWENEAVRRLGGEARDLPPEEDFPQPGDESRGPALLGELEDAHERLLAAVRAIDDEALERPVGSSEHTAYQLLHGVVQHNLYHAGQIALLLKS